VRIGALGDDRLYGRSRPKTCCGAVAKVAGVSPAAETGA
jgi:hypothetical protein